MLPVFDSSPSSNKRASKTASKVTLNREINLVVFTCVRRVKMFYKTCALVDDVCAKNRTIKFS